MRLSRRNNLHDGRLTHAHSIFSGRLWNCAYIVATIWKWTNVDVHDDSWPEAVIAHGRQEDQGCAVLYRKSDQDCLCRRGMLNLDIDRALGL